MSWITAASINRNIGNPFRSLAVHRHQIFGTQSPWSIGTEVVLHRLSIQVDFLHLPGDPITVRSLNARSSLNLCFAEASLAPLKASE